PPTSPQQGRGGDLERAGPHDLTSASRPSDATLGNPAIDHALWCAQFRKWRTIQGISARHAVSVLQWNLLDGVDFDFSSITADWEASCKDEPLTEED
ncbi:MAG: hypothetical protein AAGI03_15845, partial [Pseudomonadota bacterium]